MEEEALFRHIIMLLLTVAIKMKFHLCRISIAFPLKSGVYCNRISDFATWESERPTQAALWKQETWYFQQPKSWPNTRMRGKTYQVGCVGSDVFWLFARRFLLTKHDFFFGCSVFLLTILSWKRLWPSGCGFYFCEKELLCPWHATSKNKCSMKRTWIKMLYISRSN